MSSCWMKLESCHDRKPWDTGQWQILAMRASRDNRCGVIIRLLARAAKSLSHSALIVWTVRYSSAIRKSAGYLKRLSLWVTCVDG